ncbi:hypothetical protein SAY87_024290 [Trapa incisa]|uniref:C2H2-type domain-containing protein n=1 Tax=Trapa incisa TaxID=236973 RepID=A0AAN7GKL4_9MYRT|nr:hypothetical protein SAY87_024290 [Trapa incisa]
MSAVKVMPSDALGVKLGANDSSSTFIKQGIRKEPLSSLPRSTESPVQWIQLLHAFDNQDLPGWPLLSPVKIQMQKCDKCNKEFFSPINYRRHTRVQHRLKKLDKDSLKSRDVLRVFWDKLSADEAKELVALKNVAMEDIPGATIIKALASMIRKSSFPPLPHFCINSGSALLEIVQAKPSRFPMPSQEFFSILDDASEKTFLSGSAISMQKYLFDGEVGKIGLDTKNLVAFVSFLLEQKLVEAWLADKDAEALRCQKLLVEEEEAAQKRQAELLERKRRKKLRQKEQKAKEMRNEDAVIRDQFDSMEAEPPLLILPSVAESDLDGPNLAEPLEISVCEKAQLPISEEADLKARSEIGFVENGSITSKNIKPQIYQPSNVLNWHEPPRPHTMSNGFYQVKNFSTSKPELNPKHGRRDLKVAHTVNNKKVWSRKMKPERDGENLKFRVQEAFMQVGQAKENELMIGSIAVNLGSYGTNEKSDYHEFPMDNCELKCQSLKMVNNAKERNSESDSIHGVANQSTVLAQRLCQEVNDSSPLGKEWEVDSSALEDNNCSLHEESCLTSSVDDCDAEFECSSLPPEVETPGSLLFSSEAARTFLSLRWKQAIASDHVKLVLSPELDNPALVSGDCPEISGSSIGGIPGYAENRMVNVPLWSEIAKPELKMKPEKGLKKIYVPKRLSKT